MILEKKVIYQNGAIREFEKPEVCEAIKVANANRLTVGLTPTEWHEREDRLKKEHEENTKDPNSAKNRIKGNFPGNKSIEYCGDSMPGPGEEHPNEGNPALAESASQFNNALLDEQGKKIEELTMENERLKDQVAVLYAYKEHNKNFDRKQIKRLGKEITRINKIIHKKNMKIEELKEHLKESKESAMKYASLLSDAYDELRELKKKLANKIVDEIDAQALKSAESALAYKEKVIADLTKKLKSINMNRHNERIYKKQLAEKDEVIADLGKELAEAKKHQQQAYRSCADKNKEIRALKLQISALEKRGNGIDWKRNADAIKLYVNRASHERLWSPISQDICNEQELSFIINHGGKRVKYALRFDGTDIVYECSDPDKKPSFFRDDSVGAVTNQKDCSPVKDTHSTEDNPEEIEIEKAVKLVRKAMKEGHTVTIDYKD